jgi:hypothetical protein
VTASCCRPEFFFKRSWRKPDRHQAGALHDWALDDRRILEYQRHGAVGINDGRLAFVRQVAPCGALAVDEGGPVEVLQPVRHQFRRESLLLEVVEGEVDAVILQPGAGFLDGVAIGDAVDD